MSAKDVFDLVLGAVEVIKISIEIYKAVQDKSGIPEKLKKVSEKLPSLCEILESAEAQYQAGQPEEQIWVTVMDDVKKCKESCQELQDLLQRAYPKPDASQVGRFFKGVGTVLSGKGKTAEQLLAEINEYLKLLLDRRIITNTMLLQEIQKTVNDLLPGSGVSMNNVHGHNINGDFVNGPKYTGGSGPMFNGPGVTYNAAAVCPELKEEYRFEKLLAWLNFPSIDHRKTEIDEPHWKTFQWAVSDTLGPAPEYIVGAEFTRWLQEGQGLFWIQGILGSGKSTLMKHITKQSSLQKHLQVWAGGQRLHRASFYFTKAGTDTLQMTLQGLYRTLLAILIRNHKPFAFVAFPDWQVADREDKDPPTGKLLTALRNILECCAGSQKFCFFIDGLDELVATDLRERRRLTSVILEMARSPHVKIVAASRPEVLFETHFRGVPTIKLQELTGSDVAAFVDTEIRQRYPATDSGQPMAGTLATLADEVVRKAGGVFLWVVLAVEVLLEGIMYNDTCEALVKRLRLLPDDLHALFEQILTERIKIEHRQQVARCLMIAHRHREYHCRRKYGRHCPLVIQAIGQLADSPEGFEWLTTCNSQRIEDEVERLRKRLPSISCGIYSDLGKKDRMALVHSSMDEFLSRPETWNLVQRQAGLEFQVDVAIAVGRMAELVSRVDSTKNSAADRIREACGRQWLYCLWQILQSIELAESSTRSEQKSLFLYLDGLLERRWTSESAPVLNTIRECNVNFYNGYDHFASSNGRQGLNFTSDEGDTDFLSMTIHLGSSRYLRHRLQIQSGINSLLLYHALPFCGSYLKISLLNVESGVKAVGANLIALDLLLQNGADPNTSNIPDTHTMHESTPWSRLIEQMSILRQDHGSTCGDLITYHRNILEEASQMIMYGADIDIKVKTPKGHLDLDCYLEQRMNGDFVSILTCQGRSVPVTGCGNLGCAGNHWGLLQPHFVKVIQDLKTERSKKQLLYKSQGPKATRYARTWERYR